ncbi:hypothetical protein UPYG_G00226030 [Umbra pygmaea]|uniref:Uncharacterized protein n=1 Tax=Umbra pygmaea TaxID=75934 RepID=A0ABD0WYL2_UMBPY
MQQEEEQEFANRTWQMGTLNPGMREKEEGVVDERQWGVMEDKDRNLLTQVDKGRVSEQRDEEGSLDTDGTSSYAGSLSSREDTADITSAMVTPARPRSTEDLFAAIHRSKLKVLGRRNSAEEPCHIFSISSSSSTSFPLVTPKDPSHTPPRPLGVVGSRRVSGRKLGVSSSSDSFKALLLKKGGRCDPAARISAAERLRITAPKHQRAPAPQGQSLQCRTQSDTNLPLGVESDTRTPEPSPVNSHTPQPSPQDHIPQASPHTGPADMTHYRHRQTRTADWAVTELSSPLSSPSSPNFSPSLCGWRPPRSPTPPCSASRRFRRLPRIPMATISEQDGEGGSDSPEGKGLDGTIEVAGDLYNKFGLVSLAEEQAKATNGSLDCLESRTMIGKDIVFSFPLSLTLESSG